MGQEGSSLAVATQFYQLPQHQYALKKRINASLALWENRLSPFDELIEHRMIVNSEEELKAIFQGFKMRHQHHFLPSTRYLSYEQHGIKGCGEYYRGSLYLENKLTSLSKINDIPFEDSLHMYQVAFKGFEILHKKFGYFDVFEDMFHVCEQAKLKVWCNSQIYKLTPQAYLQDQSGRQEDMISRIIHIVDENVDHGETHNFKKTLQRKLASGYPCRTFEEVNQLFRLICRENNWHPPERLRCLANFCREDIQMIFKQQVHTHESILGQGEDNYQQNNTSNLATLRKNSVELPLNLNNDIPTQKQVCISPNAREIKDIRKPPPMQPTPSYFRERSTPPLPRSPNRRQNRLLEHPPVLIQARSPQQHFTPNKARLEDHFPHTVINYSPSNWLPKAQQFFSSPRPYLPPPAHLNSNSNFPSHNASHQRTINLNRSNQFQSDSHHQFFYKAPEFSPNPKRFFNSSTPKLQFDKPTSPHIFSPPRPSSYQQKDVSHKNQPFSPNNILLPTPNNISTTHLKYQFPLNNLPRRTQRQLEHSNNKSNNSQRNNNNHGIRYQQFAEPRNSPHKIGIQEVNSQRFLFPKQTQKQSRYLVGLNDRSEKQSQVCSSNIIERTKINEVSQKIIKQPQTNGLGFTFSKNLQGKIESEARQIVSEIETQWNPNSSLKIRDPQYNGEYTDPRLLEILSTKNLGTEKHLQQQSFQQSSKIFTELEQRQKMAFSFNNHKMKSSIEIVKLENEPQWREESRGDTGRRRNEISRDSSRSRGYSPVMDEDIWKDLQFLKQGRKHQYQI